MNWNKAKSILIVFLLCTSLILSYMLISAKEKSMAINPKTVEHTINLLSEKGITVSSDQISKRISTELIYNVENVISDYAAFAEKVFPACTPGENNSYISEDGSGKINFFADRFNITYYDGYPTSHRLKSPADKAREYLLSIGIDVGDAEITTANDSEGIFTVSFTNLLGKHPFFDCNIKAVLKGENLMSISGTWFDEVDILPAQSELKPLTSLLIDYSAHTADFRNIEIADITFGYSINEYGVYHKQSTVSPIYQIISTNGKIFYVDARGM